MLVLGDNVTLSIFPPSPTESARQDGWDLVALGPTMHKRPAVSDPSIVMLSRLDVRGRRQCHLETDLIMRSGPR